VSRWINPGARCEEGVVVSVRESVRVFRAGLQSHEVDDVDDPDLQLGQVLAQYRDRAEDLKRRGVPGARHHNIGFTILVIAGPIPDPDAFRAVHDGLIHRQPLRHGVLAGDDNVDVVAAAKTVIEHRQERVGVRRKIHPHDVGLLVHHMIKKTRVLVGEPVVVLLPHMGGEQIVKGSDSASPR
jgi:hypothetical protein